MDRSKYVFRDAICDETFQTGYREPLENDVPVRARAHSDRVRRRPRSVDGTEWRTRPRDPRRSPADTTTSSPDFTELWISRGAPVTSVRTAIPTSGTHVRRLPQCRRPNGNCGNIEAVRERIGQARHHARVGQIVKPRRTENLVVPQKSLRRHACNRDSRRARILHSGGDDRRRRAVSRAVARRMVQAG